MSQHWDQVQTEFAGDETTNFGPRMESGTALYQVDTIATISAQNQTAGKVTNLVSAAQGELVCVGVDFHLSVFKDSQHVTTIAFENLVEDCAWSPDGSLLLVVDSGGKLHLFNASALQSVFSCNLVPKGRGQERAFHRIVFRSDGETGSCDLVLLSATGLLFVVKGFESSAFTQASDNLAAVVQAQLKFQKVQTNEVHSHVTWDAVPLGEGAAITVGGGDNVIAVWKWHDNGIAFDDSVSDVFESESDIVRAKLASNDKFLYTLDEMNRVGVWLVPELVMLQCVTIPVVSSDITVHDFLLLETQGTQTNSVDGSCLVLLLRDVMSSTLQMMDMGSGKEVYSLKLDPHTSLSTCHSTQESLYVAEGTMVTGDYTKVGTVRLRCLTETCPETRLQRLLHKKRFEEALQFARLFSLDTELVYTAQMNQLLEQLSPWNVLCYADSEVAAMLEQLWTSVNNVKDCVLVAENCMRAALPSFADTWKLLQLCQAKLQSSAMNETERQQGLQTKLLELQNRLMTYRLVYGAQSYSANRWMQFQQANLLHLLCGDLAHLQPHMAILLWRRHAEEWHDQMSMEIMQELLQVVAERLPVASVSGWLNEDLLPYVLRVLPKAMGSVIQWAVQRAASMEVKEKAEWPQNAISFLETVSRTVSAITEVNFTASASTAAETVCKSEVEVRTVLFPLCSMLSMLYQLQNLLQYNLHLSLKQFQQENKETLAYRLLDQVVIVELMAPTMEKYITPYIRDHHLDHDYILASYVKDLLKRLDHVRMYSGQCAWEDKVLAIVSFITNPKEKCCAVLNVIEHAPLPWSAEIQQLVEEGLKIQHPLVEELRKAKKIADMRLLMRKYGLKCTVPNQNKAEKLAIFMVEQDREDSLTDAQWVLKEYNISNPQSLSEVYFRYANKLIRSDKVAEYLQLLHSMDWVRTRDLGERVVSLAEISLNSDVPQLAVKKALEEGNQCLTLAAVLSLQYLVRKTTDSGDEDELDAQLKTFSSLLALQREYKMTMSVREYCDEVHRGTVFAKFTQAFLQEKNPFQGSGNLTQLYRLADLLQLEREMAQGELAVVEGRAGNWTAVLFLCKELLKAEPSPQVGKVLHRVVSALLQLQGQRDTDDDDNEDDSEADSNLSDQESRRQLPFILEKMANRAVVMCDATILASCLELSKAARLWHQVALQCETADTASFLEDPVEKRPVSQDPLQTYSVDNVYRDEGVVMNSSAILPLAASSLAATLAIVHDEEESVEEGGERTTCVSSALAPLQWTVHQLKENSHLQLALRFLVLTTSTLTHTLLKHRMGFPLLPQVKAWVDSQKTAMQEADKTGVQLFHSLMSSFALKVLSAHQVDHKMALACLLSSPRKVSIDCLMKSIAACNFNCRKLKVIASVGLALGHLLRESKLVSTCQELQTNATWGVHLGKLKISFKEAFQGGLSAKHGVIGAMAACQTVDVKMVTEFSEDFNLETEDSLLVYLGELLKTCPQPWQLSKAKAVVTAVEARDRKDLLLNKLKTLYKQTNPYDYEVIEFLLKEINRLDSTIFEMELKLVSYLKMYTRRNPPSDIEIASVNGLRACKEECTDAGDMLPPGSAQRMPFHLLLIPDCWKIIISELDAQSVPQWLQIVQLLQLSVDEVHLSAVQNMVRRHVAHTTCAPGNPMLGAGQVRPKAKATSVRSWQVQEATLQVLEQVLHLMNCVRSFEMAAACANWVVRELPMGGDKVLALQGTVDYVQNWCNRCEDNTPEKEKARKALKRFQGALRKVLTEQALYVHEISEPGLLELVASPGELVTALTQHPAVTAQSGPRPDVFGTLQKVCEVNDLDVGQVLITAMTKWLFEAESDQEMETTMNLSFSNLKMTEEALDSDQNDGIQRVLYFLHRGPRPQMVKFLLDTVLTGEAKKSSNQGRMNCLYCLLQIANENDLQPLGLSCHALREMLRTYSYLSQLEELHMQHSVETLNTCNKAGLVKSIWRSYKHQKPAVRLTAALCLDHGLYSRQQWTAILQQMVSLHMLSELEEVLQRLQKVPVLWSLPVFATAWQTVLLSPLTSASVPLSDDQLKTCLHTFNLLQSCPVSSQVDLQTITQHFLQLKLDVCAAACMLMDPSVPPEELQTMVSQGPSRLMTQSYDLTAQGLSLPSATQVREVVFQQVLEQGDYELIPQQALQDFVRYIVMEDDIDGCLLFALSNHMLPQAEGLIDVYFDHFPDRYEEVVAWCHNNHVSMESPVQAYAQMKNLVD